MTKSRFINSIQGNIFIKFSLIYAIIAVLIYMTLMITTQFTFSSSAQNSAQREISALSSAMETTVNHLYNYAITTSLNDSLIKIATRYPEPPQSESEHYDITQTLNGILNSIIGLNSSISQWDILAENGEFFDVSGFDMSNIIGFAPQSIISLHENNLKPGISGPYEMDRHRISSETEKSYVFILSKPIVRLDINRTCGYIIFIIDSATISSIFEEYLPYGSNSSFYILNNQNDVLLSSDTSSIGNSFTDPATGILKESDYQEMLTTQTFMASHFNNKTLIYALRNLKDIDWKIVTSYPLEALITEQRILFAMILAITSLSLTVFLVAAYFIARSVSQPLHNLSEHMSHISEDSYETIPVPSSMEEVETLYNGYNYMMNKTNELLNSIYEKHEEMNEYQFKLLQSQIKPHFLYNTLEMIKSMIELEMYDTAGEALITLSRFYRLSLSHGEDIISIKEEMEISESYLKLEKLRHPEYFDYVLEFSETILPYEIPKLTLQPILENAVIHGMTTFSTKGLIRIQISEEAGSIIFVVEDNGQGMTSTELRNILNTIDTKQNTGSSSFGLSNVNRRLKILYGNQYHIKIESSLGHFTRFTIVIPKLKLSGEE